MLKFGRSAPFEEDIEKATSESNLTEDWSLIMHICDNAINYQDGAKFCLKAILKRLHHQVPRVVLQTLTLLDVCVKNCDRRFLLQVASSEFTTEVKKLLGKMHPSAADKLKELIQKWSLEEFKDDPELCIIPSLYYELKSKGVDFPTTENKKTAPPVSTNPDAVASQEEEEDIIKAIEISLKDTGRYSSPAEYGNSNSVTDFSPKQMAEPKKVRTMYDFDAAEDNELTIKAGEIVMVLDHSNSSWWKGSNHRGEGFFPANFVTEDLEYKVDEVGEAVTTKESVPDTSFVGEVKIDEEKIETLINWLNYTDPACESADPDDMLRLEDEVQKMGPLVEEQLQLIDKRLSMLNLVNEKIISSFDLFHSLSDNWSAIHPAMKYGTLPINQQQALPAMGVPGGFMNMPTMPNQQIMFVSDPRASQHIPSNDPSNISKPSNAPDNAVCVSSNVVAHPQPTCVDSKLNTLPQTVQAETSVSESVPHSANTSSQVPMMMNPYCPNVGGNFYFPSQVPFPYQYPPNAQNMPPQAFLRAPNSTTNFMNVPYPIPAMGPYVHLPYYYMNSPVHPQIVSSHNPQNQSQESINTSAVTAIEPSTSASTSANPLNSSDIQAVSSAITSCSYNQSVNSEHLQEISSISVTNAKTHIEPIQVSK